tara:strand:- start:133 stop:441 length:309 start_codon:yes stop_codon:yes gene_type:complete
MKKIFFSIALIILIFLTSIIKNSTKKIDAKIFNLNEDIKILNEKYELVLLDHNYLSSPKKLDEYQKKFFENDLITIDITDVEEIDFAKNKILINKSKEAFEK